MAASVGKGAGDTLMVDYLKDKVAQQTDWHADLLLARAASYEAPPQKHDLLDGVSSEERKKYPVAAGVFDYFPNALYRIARVSYEGNEKHNPGELLHWSRGKSDDHRDCEARHMLADSDEEHKAAKAWRALADLELFLEKKYNIKPPPGVSNG